MNDKNTFDDVATRMSLRLKTVADMLKDECIHRCTADVGCDHGYVSIYLVQNKISESAIAMDVRKGPLAMAESNIRDFSLEKDIQTRLSDGLTELQESEADSLVIAGMGGKLMISILEKKDISSLGIRVAVLQPQSDICLFREYLRDKGYTIADERIILDEGKYYFPMKVIPGDGVSGSFSELDRAIALLTGVCDADMALKACNMYGEHNILRKDPLLKDFLLHGREVDNSILKGLDESEHSERYLDVKNSLDIISAVLTLYD